jgi:hypothetical protein
MAPGAAFVPSVLIAVSDRLRGRATDLEPEERLCLACNRNVHAQFLESNDGKVRRLYRTLGRGPVPTRRRRRSTSSERADRSITRGASGTGTWLKATRRHRSLHRQAEAGIYKTLRRLTS